MEQKDVTVTQNGQEEEVMPSYFKSLKSSESHQLTSWEWLEKMVKTSPELKAMTEIYRKRYAISKRYADELKPDFPCLTISALMDGYGKQLANLVKPTYKLMLDFDKISPKELSRLLDIVKDDQHAFFVHVTVSQRGFRIYCKYLPYDDDDVSILELFDIMIKKAMDYYTQLLGVTPDKACVDITRSAGLAHDPDAFLNLHALPFAMEMKDVKALYLGKAAEARRSRRAAQRKYNRDTAKAEKRQRSKAPSMEEAAPKIQELIQAWGYSFEPSSHNEYVCHFGKVCNLYGIPEEDATAYAITEFSGSYPPTAGVMKSCYKHKDKFGTWHFYRDGEGYSRRPAIRTIKQWLDMRYEFRHNEVTGFYEVRSKMVVGGKYLRWTNIEDSIAHSIWVEMNEQGLNVSDKTLQMIVNSDFSESFDPLDEYLKSLKPWDKEHDPDYIDQLADRICVANMPEDEHTQELFRYFFKKWIVGMVVGWVKLSVVNQIILIFVGKGGIYKTTFFAYLLPPILRRYFINDSTACYTDKDFMESFASKALTCLDEFETLFGKNLSAFKSNVTKLTFSLRRPYDKYRSELPHRATLCGTSNSQQFITEEENRRYCPWIVKSIVSPIDNPIDYDHVYAQAVALGQKVELGKKSGKMPEWTYWLTGEDIELMRRHNRLFMVSNFAEEQILRFYRVPTADTSLHVIKKRYTAEILERICTNPALRQNLNNQNIGTVMKHLGFKKEHKERGNVWLVVEKDGAEINNDSMM